MINAAARALLLLALIIAALSWGGATARGEALTWLAAIVAGLAAGASMASKRDRGALPAAAVTCWFAWMAWAAFALVPLPIGLLGAISPESAASQESWSELLGRGTRGLSLDPMRTAHALLIAGSWTLALIASHRIARMPHGRRWIAWCLVGVAVASALVGLIRTLAFGRVYGRPFSGFLANRNHDALLFVLGGIMAAGLLHHGQRVRLALGSLALMTLAILATASRAGLLLGVAAASYLAMTSPSFVPRISRRSLAIVGVVAALLLAAGIASPVRRMFDSFRELDPTIDGSRGQIWQDSFALAERFGATGSGLGTFRPLYWSVSSAPTTRVPDYAHSESLNVLVETGAPGLLLLIAAFTTLLLATRPCAFGEHLPPFQRHAWIGVIVIAMHSGVDFPMRIPLLSLSGAMMAGMMRTPGERDEA